MHSLRSDGAFAGSGDDPGADPDNQVELPQGTQARLALQTQLSSKLNEVGDQVIATLYESVRFETLFVSSWVSSLNLVIHSLELDLAAAVGIAIFRVTELLSIQLVFIVAGCIAIHLRQHAGFLFHHADNFPSIHAGNGPALQDRMIVRTRFIEFDEQARVIGIIGCRLKVDPCRSDHGDRFMCQISRMKREQVQIVLQHLP